MALHGYGRVCRERFVSRNSRSCAGWRVTATAAPGTRSSGSAVAAVKAAWDTARVDGRGVVPQACEHMMVAHSSKLIIVAVKAGTYGHAMLTGGLGTANPAAGDSGTGSLTAMLDTSFTTASMVLAGDAIVGLVPVHTNALPLSWKQHQHRRMVRVSITGSQDHRKLPAATACRDMRSWGKKPPPPKGFGGAGRCGQGQRLSQLPPCIAGTLRGISHLPHRHGMAVGGRKGKT